MRVCRSPALIAAYRALHRLCVPRHPPHTFVRLTLPNLFKQSTRFFERVSVSRKSSFENNQALRLTEVLRPSCRASTLAYRIAAVVPTITSPSFVK
jgi:hypothetical protein